MQGSPRRDREWEHWPTERRLDDGLRHRLRALFQPTDGERQVEALIAARGRELEERTTQLTETLADLERREERTVGLRDAFEEMLRAGATELDERQSQLNALAAELAEREGRLRALDGELGERRRELGAVELHRATVERRERALDEREATLERISEQLAERERDLLVREGRLAERAETAADASADEPERTHLLFLAGERYRLREGDGPPPAAGAVVQVDEAAYAVVRTGASPLPGDSRRCAFLVPAAVVASES
jgi:hypothetical protein